MSGAAMPQVSHARLLMALTGAAAAAAAVVAGQWKAAVGIGTGIAAMAGALELARVRAATLQAARRDRTVRVLHGLLQLSKYVVAFAVLWAVLNVLRAPLWSVCVGVTAGVACLIAAFARKPNTSAPTDMK